MASIQDEIKGTCNSQLDHVDPLNLDMGRHHPSRITERRKGVTYWFLVISSVVASIVGQATAILLGRFYYEEGGHSRWILTLSQCLGWPILLPILLKRSKHLFSMTPNMRNNFLAICGGLGMLSAVDFILLSWGLSFLPASTFTLLCATQLAFAGVFAFVLIGQRMNAYVVNSLVLVTLSAIMLGIHHSERPQGTSNGQFVLGFVFTITGAAIIALILTLMQLVFTHVVSNETFSVVVETQACVNIVASLISVTGLLASGEFRKIKDEAHSFKSGTVAYCMTLAWIAVGCQVAYLGTLGLTFLVSSLFSNVINTLSVPIASIFAVFIFKDSMDGIKIISMLLSLWGLASYVFGADDNSRVPSSSRG